MVACTAAFLFDFALPAAGDYFAAEAALTQVFAASNGNLANCQIAANLTIRRAYEAAIALDGLTDRAAIETGQSMTAIRQAIDSLCVISGTHRAGAYDRVSAAANAYKHSNLTNARHPITSMGNLLAVGAGFGVDGYGIGKNSGVEVLLTLSNGTRRKFLSDVPYAVRGWLSYLHANGAALPNRQIGVCGTTVWP